MWLQVSAEDGIVRGFDIRAAASTADFDGKPMFTLHAHDKAICTISYNPVAYVSRGFMYRSQNSPTKLNGDMYLSYQCTEAKTHQQSPFIV